MLFVDIDKDHAEALARALEADGATVTRSSEERYFGDAQTINLMIEYASSTVDLIANSIAIATAVKGAMAWVNHKRVGEKNGATADEVKEEVIAAANP